MTRIRALTVGLAATTTSLLLLALPPWLLTTLVGPPIPSSWPDLDTLRNIATLGVTHTFVTTTLAVIVWIAWGQLATAIVAETVAALRHRPARTLPLFPGTQHVAARLVAATLLLASMVQARPVVAAPLQLIPATAIATPDTATVYQPAAAPTSTPTVEPVRVTTETVTVGERDSWWSLAETHLDDGRRWREIRELNLDRTLPDGTTIRPDTDQLEPGWPLLVPTDAHTPAREPAQPNPPEAAPSTSAPSQQWEVEPGDHFWHIAQTTLEHAWDRTPTDDEIGAYWRTLVETNRDRLAPPHNPDLIHPGQQFQLPALPHDPQAPEQAATSEMKAEVHPSADAHAAEPDRPNEPEARPSANGRHQTPADTATPENPTTEEAAATDAEPDAATDRTDDRDESPAGIGTDVGGHPLGVARGAAPAATAAALAAAGVVALLQRRRRILLHQRLPGYRLPTLAPDVEQHLATLTHVAPDDPVLEDLTALLATIPPDCNPPLVIFHDSGPISLIVDDHDTKLPAPWERDPASPGEPARWSARIGDRGPRRSIGLPLLVTLGHTGTSTVLANLGALAAFTMQGPDEQVRTRLRAMTLELATSRTAGPLEVTVCDDDQFVDLDQIVTADDPSDAINATIAESDAGIIDDDRIPRAVICHAATDSPLPEAAARFCGQLAAGVIEEGGWGLRVDGDHGWLHGPGKAAQPLTLPELDPAVIGQALDQLCSDDALTPEASESSGEASAAVLLQIDAPYCHVAVLGPITVTCDGAPVDGLTPIARQLLTYLATHRDGVTLEQLDATIWPDRPPSHAGQRARTALARLRRSLGDGPDGEPLLARRERVKERIRLSDHVGTDLDQAFALLVNARRTDDPTRALEDQIAALSLVRGSPFTDLTVSWSVDIEQRAIAQLQDAAVAAATALSNAGDHDRAAWAIQQGLLLCDPAEPLYVTWARIEQARGRADRIPQLWRRLRRLYADDADELAGMITTPTTETELAFTQLMSHT
jgi:DNA-binding SARP family transcriptional activator/nucleoid-associated protein YgaU